MFIVGIVAISIGVALVLRYLLDWFGKRRMLTGQALPARVVSSKNSVAHDLPMGESAVARSYAIKTVFDVPGHGLRHHDQRFDCQEDAQAWASRYAVDSRHDIYLHPYLTRSIFLPHELIRQQPAVLLIGIIFILTGSATLLFMQG